MNVITPASDFNVDDLISKFTSLCLESKEVLKRLDGHDNQFKEIQQTQGAHSSQLNEIKAQLNDLQKKYDQLQITSKVQGEQNKDLCNNITKLMNVLTQKEQQRQGTTPFTLIQSAGRASISFFRSTAKFVIWSFIPFFLEIHRNAHKFATTYINQSYGIPKEDYKAKYSEFYWQSFSFQLEEVGITGQMFYGFEGISSYFPSIMPSVGSLTDIALIPVDLMKQLLLGNDSLKDPSLKTEESELTSPYTKALFIAGVTTFIFSTTLACYLKKRKNDQTAGILNNLALA